MTNGALALGILAKSMPANTLARYIPFQSMIAAIPVGVGRRPMSRRNLAIEQSCPGAVPFSVNCFLLFIIALSSTSLRIEILCDPNAFKHMTNNYRLQIPDMT